jgi:NADH-quinone oxidoreductase subunit J
VHAALWLVVTLGGLAVEYLLLTAEFIAWVQVLIYVGSVVVLLLFGLMLTRAPIGRSEDADSRNRPLAAAVAVLAAAGLVWVVTDAFRTTYIHLDGAAPQGTTAVTGAFLFRHWVLPFEALSVLLLAALVGAIVLSRKRDGGGAPRRKRAPRPRTAPARPRPPARGGAGAKARRGAGRTAGAGTTGGTGPRTGTGPGTGADPRTGTGPRTGPAAEAPASGSPASEAPASATSEAPQFPQARRAPLPEDPR